MTTRRKDEDREVEELVQRERLGSGEFQEDERDEDNSHEDG